MFFFSLILWEESWDREDWQPSSWSRRPAARWWWEARAPWGTKRRSVGTSFHFTSRNFSSVWFSLTFNVVARIVSPRVRWGMTRKQLEQETGCKIILRGRDGAPPTLVMRLRSDHLASLLCTEYHQPRPPWNWPDWVKLSDRKINPRNLFVTAQCAQCAQYVCYIIKLLMTQLINDNWSYSHKNSKCLTPNHWKKYLDVLELSTTITTVFSVLSCDSQLWALDNKL